MIVECVNVLGFMTGHRLDDLRNNSCPGDLTTRRVEACARSSITFNLSAVRNCHSLTLSISVLQYEFPNDLF